MRYLLILLITIFFLSGKAICEDTLKPTEAEDQATAHDCRVTAELSVMLLKTKAKSTPDQLFDSAVKFLSEKKYKDSFGDIEYVAGLYSGMALQMGIEVDKLMEKMSSEDLRLMELDHEMACLKNTPQ